MAGGSARQAHRGSFSRGLCELLTGILIVDPKKRYTASQILEHPWVKEEEASFMAGARAGPGVRSDEKLAADSEWDVLPSMKGGKGKGTSSTGTSSLRTRNQDMKHAPGVHTQARNQARKI